MTAVSASVIGASLLIWANASSGLVASDVIRAGDRITEANTSIEGDGLPPGEEALFGREVRRTVYAGQRIKPENTQAPRIVKRNQIVTVKYLKGALEISVSARAMEEGAAGDEVSVMNLESRNKIHGVITKEGWVLAR